MSGPSSPAAVGEARRHEIYDAAARLFHRQGFATTSMSDVANALGLTKAGLYHHVKSKEQLLFETMNYGLDLLEERVIKPAENIPNPAEKLRRMIRGHVHLILQDRCREVTVILHENRTLRGSLRSQINARKKRYIHGLRNLIAELRPGGCSSVDPGVGAFALLGMINWLYQWYRPTGRFDPDQIAAQFTDLFLHGLLGGASPLSPESPRVASAERECI